MKFLTITLAAAMSLLLTACPSAPVNPGPGPVVTTTTLPAGPQEPAHHEQPTRLDNFGRKVGGYKQVSGNFYQVRSGEAPANACPAGSYLFSQCGSVGSSCSYEGKRLECTQVSNAYKIFGWVYLEEGANHTRFQGAKVEMFRFTDAFLGPMNPHAGPVYSDEWGYYELYTSSYPDMISHNVKDIPGIFAYCRPDKKHNFETGHTGWLSQTSLGPWTVRKLSDYPTCP